MTDPRLLNTRGLIEPEQGERLAFLASWVAEYESIVEIGTHTGLSTCYMALAAQAHVFAIDPWGDPRPGSKDDPFELQTGDAVLAEFLNNLGRMELESKVTPLRATGHEVASMWVKPVGLLFIDAVHEGDAARHDIEDWVDKIEVSGWLALHDYAPEPDHPYHGVAIVADELAASGKWAVAPLVGSLWTAQKL